jgi:hypothetical protein
MEIYKRENQKSYTKGETTFSSLFGQINARKSAKKFFLNAIARQNARQY